MTRLLSRRWKSRGILPFVLRRLALAALVVLAVAVVDYGMIRGLRPDLDPSRGLVGGTLHDLDRVFLHFDFGRCIVAGCPSTAWLWKQGWQVDVWLLGGALAFGVTAGLAGGLWCAQRPRSVISRALEWAAMVFYCLPSYVLGLGLLLLFAPVFGVWELPWFFDSGSYLPLAESPWDWVRSMALPWVVLGLPVAASVLRLTVALMVDDLQADYVRTAWAKGLPRRTVLRRHAAPAAYPAVASFVGISVPMLVTNVVLVEWVFGVPGFFRVTKRAIGKTDPPIIDIPTLQALALWAAVLIVATSVIADIALARLDPRVRAGAVPA